MNLDLWKQRKKELKLKYEDISALSGIPLTTVKYIFCGYVTTPRIDTVEAIERALGINSALELTDEEKALGVGRHATHLSEDEWKWLELRSEVLQVKGEAYLNTLITMIEGAIKTA